MKNLLKRVLIVLPIIGLIDASYLTYQHFSPYPIPCSSLSNCEIVTTSIYSQIAGVPVALFGVLFYLTSFVLSVLIYKRKKKVYIGLLLLFSSFAFLASVGFVYIQLFVLRQICEYCMLSAVVSTLIFISSLFISRKDKLIVSGDQL